MKYFTMGELDEITNELLENPSKETLKRLSDKFYGVDEIQHENNGVWNEVPNLEYMNEMLVNVAPKEEDLQNSGKYSAPSIENNHNGVITLDDGVLSTLNIETSTSENHQDISDNHKVDVKNDPSQQNGDIFPNIQLSNDEESINDPLLQIEPYNKPQSSQPLDIQVPKSLEVNSMMSEAEEAINKKKDTSTNSNGEKTEIKTQDEKIEIIPYKEYLGNNMKSSSPKIKMENGNALSSAPIINDSQSINQVNAPEEIPNEQIKQIAPLAPNNFEPSSNVINNMMQTTDNFNVSLDNYSPNINLVENNNISEMPNQINNSIMMPQQSPSEGPSLISQFEQNSNGNVA